MIQNTKDKVKSTIIVLLIFISVVQIGILWNSKTHGLPFNFIADIFLFFNPTNRIDLNEVKAKYSAPESLIVSEGLGLYSVYNNNNELYNRVWSDFRQNYVNRLKESKPIEYEIEYWDEIIEQRVFIIELSTFIDSEIFMWLMGEEQIDDLDFSGVERIVISPWEDDVNNIMTIYINENEKLYRYKFNIMQGSLSKKDYTDIIENIAKKKTTDKYNLLKDYFPRINFRKDILLTNRYNSNKRINDLYAFIPKRIQFDLKDRKDSEIVEGIMEFVLMDQKDSFFPETDSVNNAYLFTEEDSFYRIYQNGLFEYKYLKSVDTKDAGSITDALSNALIFIENHSNLMEETNNKTRLLLKSIKHDSTKKRYHFCFDYAYGEYQIFMRYNQVVTSTRVHAVEIVADSQRILECKWYVREFNDKPNNNVYNTFFTDIYDKAREIHSDLDLKNLIKENKFVSEYDFGYVVNYNEFDFVSGMQYQPKAIFTQISQDGPRYYISDLNKIE